MEEQVPRAVVAVEGPLQPVVVVVAALRGEDVGALAHVAVEVAVAVAVAAVAVVVVAA